MRTLYKMLAILIALFAISFTTMKLIEVGEDSIGREIINLWINERAPYSNSSVDINSFNMVLEQAVSLTAFLFVVVGAVVRMEWRIGLAILGIVAITFTAIVPPEALVNKSIEWNLILFLIGSMTLAGLLRELGVFRYLAVNIVRVTRRSSILLLSLILLLSFITAAVLDEVTSIVYTVMLVFELSSIMNIDPRPLLILTVLATNTGSLALPIGNPIGVYLFFKAGMPILSYIRYSMPLAALCFAILLLLVLFVERDLVKTMSRRLSERAGKIEAFIHHYYIGLNGNAITRLRYGLLMLLGFIAMVALNDNIALLLEKTFSQRIEPHSLLAFVPYIFIALSIAAIRLEDVPKYLEKSVEWPSLMFFICLFILSYSLTYSGVMAKLAYLLSRSASPILSVMILSSTLLSSILDNLSVVIAFTPIAAFMNRVGLTSDLIYFSLLYGGVLGGNYTPIGSTANIVALSIAEKRRVKITWSIWLKKSLVIASAQVIAAVAWLYACFALNI